MKKQRAEITFETEETIVFREGSRIQTAFCPACGECVLMSTPQATVFFSGSTEREIFRLLESGKIHFTETGHVMICLKSISEFFKELNV